MELKALIFDVDGTLADTEEIHRVAFNKAFQAQGLSWVWSKDVYKQLLAVTGGKERICHYVTTFEPSFKSGQDLTDFAANLHKQKTAVYTQMLADGSIHLRPGVERLLREARSDGLRIAVATTTTLANFEALINNAISPEAMAWFDVIGAGDVVPHKKPAADIYWYALEQLKLPPEQCLAFEDSENGICASKGANLKTIITVNHYTQDHDFTSAALVLDKMGEPNDPFKVLSGDAFGHTYLNLDLVKKIHHHSK